MILSMTGFAAQTRDLGHVSLHLELRSVNSRFLDLAFRICDDLRQAEPALRELFSGKISRGKLECRLNMQVNASGSRDLALNGALLERLVAAGNAVREHLPEAAPLSVAEVLRWPGMLADDSVTFEQLQPTVLELARVALDELVASRRREGEKLADMIRERLDGMRKLVAMATPRMPALVCEYQDKLTARLRDAVACFDEDRIRQEVALFAQRIDVAEELTRLNTHIGEVERVLKTGGASGKRLDFLMQELNREANTLASKSVASDITGIAMELKILIEQMREQVQNIE